MAFGMSKKNATARAEKLLDVEIAIASVRMTSYAGIPMNAAQACHFKL